MSTPAPGQVPVRSGAPAGFDGSALTRAIEADRERRGLLRPALADALHAQSSALNDRLGGDAMCPGALARTVRRGTMSCQYALVLLRFLGRAPEDFLRGPRTDTGDDRLPEVGLEHRLRFDLPALHTALDERRRADGMTWASLGALLDCSPARLTNLRTARLADMALVMQVTQHLAVPAQHFVRATDW